MAFSLALVVYRSRLLPQFLGVVARLAGCAWVILSLTGIVLPQITEQVNTCSQACLLREIASMLWLMSTRPPSRQFWTPEP